MERKFIGRDILEWMIGYYVLLAIIFQSAFLPLVFLVPLFFIWRAINHKQLSINELHNDKSITTGTMRMRKFGYGVLFTVICIIFGVLIVAYKLYGEYYWLHYVAVPAATKIGDFFNSVVDFIHSSFDSWTEHYKSVVAVHNDPNITFLERLF